MVFVKRSRFLRNRMYQYATNPQDVGCLRGPKDSIL